MRENRGGRAERFWTLVAFGCSGYVYYCIDRANTAIFSVACVCFFLLFYRSKNKIYQHLSCIALALAVSFKVYPVIFGVLLLFEKRWKQAIYAILYGLAAVFLPFLFFEDGFSAIPLLIRNVELNSQFYHGGPLSFVTNQIIDTSSFMELGFAIAKIIAVGAIIISGVQKVYWKRIALLTCALILTPTHSGYYCGLYLLIPVLYFLNEENHQKIDWVYLIMFLITISPLQYTIKLPHFWLLKESVATSTVQNSTITLLYLFLFIDTILSLKSQKLKVVEE